MAQKIALLFPGQGSQSVGMLSELLESSDIVKATFSEASSALGYDLAALVLNGPEEELNQTHRTQPALLTASVAIYRHWLAANPDVDVVMAGHSLGEYSALVCSEVISLGEAVKLVENRGLYMQEAVPAGVGSMAAIIGLGDEQIKTACEESAQGEVVSPVNYNSPGQVVIAGHKAAVDRASQACKDAGAKRALPLSVSVPSHCELMKPAAEKLANDLAALTFNTPKCDVINNVDVKAQSSADAIKDALVRQLYSPVRWTETVQALVAQGITQSYEFGPGKVLTGLAKRIDKAMVCGSVNDAAAIDAAK
ncbi:MULTISPECIES: ACP S-malonyltransferase [Pseudoalteromonas]|uniref:[acyl-carrier-protein] S-malonyltransferase n=1 Tax=Pseudoalteromonas agarivorans DSM 14585 TaxID=1312369 RepID=A0ACA8DXC2_9GAMM|nr:MULTISPECIES: ACP S-malonyltransferase [Pseudoalteromonas]MDC9519568.1 ACP S-malonyltransferase [Pseudoalteromonas sp. Angola-31]HAG40782.1 [acyl-carrier-protein] S-malonyltransferase [Pseudoalteromonas sp.]ATC82584.1 [acyl-carrier-protein] S-malonyltransferase [Pseudoalteromonas agarivorans DSM 14585]KPV92401.1 Malonyl CoA-acyl carrier protein transacylase [Pseudoalteromonas sp. P1-30]KPW03085.1 Malonyl CoA-acyl carrier protein transacylase [Pseudoalteromonas sp. P1-11]|tara:strand:- start:985 stop:1911 length:927 start_codon:yes stop_codon:yes gene_type:complete